MRQATFDKLRDIVYDASGISLSPAKLALLTARTGKRMRVLGLTDHDDYLKRLEDDESGAELVCLLDVVSTNVTSFFREPSHFDVARLAVQDWLAEGRLRLRFWSAACSSGEEPYSLAMTVLDTIGNHGVDVRILGTDISTRALTVANEGRYSESRTETIPEDLRERYATRTGDRGDRAWSMGDQVREMCVFRRLNLSTPPYPISGPLDMIFCRNVMIYFDKRVRQAVLDEMHRVLRPGGLLIVGHAESLAARAPGFRLVRPSVFRRD